MTQPLSPREIETLAAYGATHSTKETAWRMGISPLVVRNHLASIRQKLGVIDTWEAWVVALREGLLTREDIDQQLVKSQLATRDGTEHGL